MIHACFCLQQRQYGIHYIRPILRSIDAALIYEIKTKTTASKQGNRSVTDYASLLQNQWQDLNYYRTINLKCSDCEVEVKNFIERDRVYDFLAGLNPEFDLVRIQVLGRPELPSLSETISIVRAEESHRGVMLESIPSDSSALYVGKSSKPGGSQLDMSKPTNKDELWCTFCKKPRHTRETCWKLNDKPPSKEWGNKEKLQFKSPTANQTITSTHGDQRRDSIQLYRNR